MTKQEKILEAWGDNLPPQGTDENGWSNEYIWYENIDSDLFDTKLVGHGYCSRRPITLKGIEDNNGWIKIESDSDLPDEKDKISLYMPCENGRVRADYSMKEHEISLAWASDYVSHYRKIEIPEPPIY